MAQGTDEKLDVRGAGRKRLDGFAVAGGLLPLIVLVAMAISLRPYLPAWGFMWALAGGIFFGLKWLSWWRGRLEVAHAAWRSWAYLFAWPGMDAVAFLGAARPARPLAWRWIWALAKTLAGISLLFF